MHGSGGITRNKHEGRAVILHTRLTSPLSLDRTIVIQYSHKCPLLLHFNEALRRLKTMSAGVETGRMATKTKASSVSRISNSNYRTYPLPLSLAHVSVGHLKEQGKWGEEEDKRALQCPRGSHVPYLSLIVGSHHRDNDGLLLSPLEAIHGGYLYATDVSVC